MKETYYETKPKAIRGLALALCAGIAFWCVVIAGAVSGCRTYYVYQFGDHPAINVDAKVDKEITPTLKASVQ